VAGTSDWSLTPCDPGYECPAGTKSATQYPCDFGEYQPYSGQGSCMDCDPGSYCDDQGLSAVSGDCDGGYYCKGANDTATPSSTKCLIGYYCPAGSAYMIPCTPGKYCATTGLAAPHRRLHCWILLHYWSQNRNPYHRVHSRRITMPSWPLLRSRLCRSNSLPSWNLQQRLRHHECGWMHRLHCRILLRRSRKYISDWSV